LGVVTKNEIVDELGVNADRSWIKIRRADGLTGWSSSRYLDVFTALPPGSIKGTYRITTARLNVREGPATTYNSIGYVQQNEIVEALDANANISWRKIRKGNGLTGWASAKYMERVTNQ
jgi:uncharacterized protein YgiM (DUF1202 family)